MRTAREIQQNITDLRDEIDAIMSIAEREERDLNEDEGTRVTKITDELLPALNKQHMTVLKIEKEREQRSYNRIAKELEEVAASSGNDTFANKNGGRFSAIKVPAKAKVHGSLQAYKGEDAERDAYIAGNFILASVFNVPSAQQFCQQHGLLGVNAGMFSGDNKQGGWLVPDELSRTLIRLREERGVFPQYANRIPMGSDNMTVPRLLADVTAYWVGQSSGSNQEITSSDATLGAAELTAKKLAALTKVSSELDEDAVVDIGDMITLSMAYAMADKIDDAAFNGDGTSTYGGITGLKNALHANAIQDAVTGNVSALTLDLDDFEATVGKYPQYSGASPRWFMHSAVYYASCARLMDAAGGNTNMTIANGIPSPMFLGYPVTFTQVMPSTTGSSVSTILAYFGDLRLGASYGVRRSFRTQILPERYAEYDLIGIKTTERLAILCHETGETIRTRPIVALKTAAA